MSASKVAPSPINGQDKVAAQHTQRVAYVYIRQSSPGQVAHHKESQRNQARMADYATALGWHPDQIRVINADQGLTAATSQGRGGFQELMSEVTLGQVGIIFGYEVSRLARNNSDWHRLLEIAAVFDTLIGDFDGIYDLGLFNDRLLLGLKGTMSEAELHLLHLRLDEGRKRQIERGEYRQGLPTGLVRLPEGMVVKDPDDQIRHAIEMVFAQFDRLGSCRQVVAYCHKHNIPLPRCQMRGPEQGQVVWKPAAMNAVYAIITNPAYAGAFVFGRRPVDPRWRYRDARPTTHPPRIFKPMEDWEIIHHDVYPAYITWDTYLRHQAQLRQNRMRFSSASSSTQGAVREGAGLLQGMVVCGKCGHHMQTIYKPEPKYVCQALSRRFGRAPCAFLGSPRIDQIVVQAFFEALQPAQLDVLETVLKDQAAEQSRLTQQWTDQLKRAQYEAHLAARQYHSVDPDNRLVAAELERRWDSKLQQLQEVEAAYVQFQQALPTSPLSPDLCEQFRSISTTLPQLWDHLPSSHKKELLRTLVASVILTRLAPDDLEVKIVWASSYYSVLHLQLPTARNADVPGHEQMMARLKKLWEQGHSDAEIAKQLTAEGFHSARSTQLSAATIKGFRLRQGWYHPAHRPVVAPEGYFTITGLAAQLQVSGSWIYRRIHNSQIDPQFVTRHPKSNAFLIRNDPVLLDALRNLICDCHGRTALKSISTINAI